MIKKIALVFCLTALSYCNAQTELKFNLVSAAALIPNIGIEIQISENVSVQVIKSTISQVLSKTEPKK